MNDDDDSIKILDHEVAFQGFARIDRYRLKHRLYAGGWSEEMQREIFDRKSSVGVLLYDPIRDIVVLIEQFRLAAHLAELPAWQIEIVAGMLDHSGESAADVAQREAKEEAGLAILGDPQFIHRYMPSSGACTEIVDLYCGRVDARDAGGIHGLAGEHEDIKVLPLKFKDAMARVQADQIHNGLTLLALYWLAANRTALRKHWKASAD
jgi:ADP-ribose pyrophosphatase